MVSSHDPDEGPKPLISNSKLIVFACCYSNDGTTLKASVEFDPVTKRNIGLTVPVDLNFVKEDDPPDPKMLQELIVTEAVLGSITMLDNKVSVPVPVDYTTKAEKTGENMEEMFTKHVETLQMCKSCTEETKASDLIIEANPICESYCKNCYKNKELCSPCIEDGQISIFPSVRICKRCIAQSRQCIRRAVLVITNDCEGNKQMFLSLKSKIKMERTNTELSLTVPLPDAPHLGKSFKASFSNWVLKLFSERGCLAFLHTLKNKSTRDQMAETKKLIPKNDYVRNKDRQDPIAVLKLSDNKLVDQLFKVGYVVQTIITETAKYTKKNKVGMYTNPIDICIGPYGYLFMITYDNVKMEIKIFKVQLHNPVEKFGFLKSVKGRQM